MKACDNKLRTNLMEAMKLDNQKLEAEMQGIAPHEFSEAHEQKMNKLLSKQARKRKVRGVLRYAVAACLVLLLTGSILIISSKDLRASKLSVDIIEWLEEFFSAEKGEIIKRTEDDVLFSEEQIGYLPEGFEKVAEGVSFNAIYFKYEDGDGEKLHVSVVRDKALLQIDSKETIYEVSKNELGYEYTYTYSEESKTSRVVWMSKNSLYYYISSTLPREEVEKIMNNISY